MLKIQVLGSGLIPRGYGLAPKKDPFTADLTLIGTILSTAGLKLNYVHPESGRLLPLTRENHIKVYNAYGKCIIKKNDELKQENDDSSKEKESNIIKDQIPSPPATPPVSQPLNQNSNTDEDKDPIIPPTSVNGVVKGEEFGFKPIVKPDEVVTPPATNSHNNRNNNRNNR